MHNDSLLKVSSKNTLIPKPLTVSKNLGTDFFGFSIKKKLGFDFLTVTKTALLFANRKPMCDFNTAIVMIP